MQNAVQSRLKNYVKSNGIKQRYIAQATGIKEYLISDIFCMRRDMRADEFMAICIAIGKSPNDFSEDSFKDSGGEYEKKNCPD